MRPQSEGDRMIYTLIQQRPNFLDIKLDSGQQAYLIPTVLKITDKID
jgi:hypothetical protein